MFFLSNNKPFHRAVCHTEEAIKTCAITITRASILKFTPVPWIFFFVGKDMLQSRFERNLLESGNLTMCNGEWGNWGDGLGFVGCWGEWRSCGEKKICPGKFLHCFLSQSLNPPLSKTPGSAPALHHAVNYHDRNLFRNHTKEIYLNKFTFYWK